MLTYYIVQRRDTLYTIAVKFGTTVCVIARLNNMDENDVLRVGMKLLVPVNNWRAPSWWQDGMVLFNKLTKEQMRILMDEENCRMPRPRREAETFGYAESNEMYDENAPYNSDFQGYQPVSEYSQEQYSETYQDYQFGFDNEIDDIAQGEDPVTPSAMNSIFTYSRQVPVSPNNMPEEEPSPMLPTEMPEMPEMPDDSEMPEPEAVPDTPDPQPMPQRPDIPNINCQYYTVVAGDTLAMIARKFNSTVLIIQNVNKIRDLKNLQVGTMLCIPKSPRNSYLYTVRTGDTINKIAGKFGVNADKIIKDNYLNPLMPLIPGSQLLIVV